MPHFKELLDPNFLSNIDFINDQMKYDKKIVTIESVQRETTHNGKGGDESVTTLHFKECKPLILSNRNFKTILRATKLVDTDKWKGIGLELVILENLKAFGQLWDVVRIGRVMPATQAKPVDYSFQIEQLESCQTIEQLQATFLAFNADQKAATVSTKDQMKTKLSNRDENKLLRAVKQGMV